LGGHHGDEIAVDVAGRLDRHVVHHLDHRGLVLFPERSFVDGNCRRWRRGRMGFVRKDEWRKCKCDKKARAKDRRADTWSRKPARQRCHDAAK